MTILSVKVISPINWKILNYSAVSSGWAATSTWVLNSKLITNLPAKRGGYGKNPYPIVFHGRGHVQQHNGRKEDGDDYDGAMSEIEPNLLEITSYSTTMNTY